MQLLFSYTVFKLIKSFIKSQRSCYYFLFAFFFFWFKLMLSFEIALVTQDVLTGSPEISPLNGEYEELVSYTKYSHS